MGSDRLDRGEVQMHDETLRNWEGQVERDAGKRLGLATQERERLKQLEGEVKELRRANEILRKASAFFAQAELDRQRRTSKGPTAAAA